MRRLLLFATCLAACTTIAMAQTKLETKWHCDKPSAEQSYDVGDAAGHSYAIVQGACQATSSTSGEKSGAYTEFQERWKSSFANRGRFTVTMDNGDKTYYTYEGSGKPEQKMASNKYKIVNGTGKQKGAKGTGGCAGKLNDDGSSDWDCSGTLSAAK